VEEMNAREIILVIVAAVAFVYLWSYAGEQKRKDSLVPYQKRVAELNRPRLLDFYSKTCGPCQAFEPTWNEAKAKYGNQADFFRVEWGAKDPDRLIANYGVQNLPTIIFIDRHGNEVGREIGWPHDEFTKELESTIAK
jgi:thioredoxin 1